MAWDKEFWDNKKRVLFDGIPLHYEVWGRLSDVGSHANIKSMCERFRTTEIDGQTQLNLAYTGLNEKAGSRALHFVASRLHAGRDSLQGLPDAATV